MKHPTQPFEPGQQYVLGFAFGCDGNAVLLIKKTKPKWQVDKLNGVGGKIEPDDWSIESAMVREFQEETGIVTEEIQWAEVCQHCKPGAFNGDPSSYTLHVLTTSLTVEQMTQLSQPTEEIPVWQGLYDGTLHDLLDKNYAVDGALLYIAMALNHTGRPFSTMTIEAP